MPDLRKLISECTPYFMNSVMKFKQCLIQDGHPKALVKAIMEESETTFKYLISISQQTPLNRELEKKVIDALQKRLNYINNTYAACIDSPINVITGLLCKELGLQFRPRVNPQTSPANSIKQLEEGFDRYKIELMGSSLRFVFQIELAQLLLRAISRRDGSSVKYLMCLDDEKNTLVLWICKELIKYGSEGDTLFLMIQIQETRTLLKTLKTMTCDPFTDFTQQCNKAGIDGSDAKLLFYAKLILNVMKFNHFLNPNQKTKIAQLEAAVRSKNPSATIRALHMSEDPTFFFTPSVPQCIEKMPHEIKEIIQSMATDPSTRHRIFF